MEIMNSKYGIETKQLTLLKNLISTYWNQGYGYQQGYGPGYGGSDYSPHGYYGYGPGYYYSEFSELENCCNFQKIAAFEMVLVAIQSDLLFEQPLTNYTTLNGRRPSREHHEDLDDSDGQRRIRRVKKSSYAIAAIPILGTKNINNNDNY
ncbi:Contactin-Associated Protein 1 [Manis pentadactyla]|nr:Contactin-Associated Protein 1 [Manis pentadactyla]